jgi:hypothetical protein
MNIRTQTELRRELHTFIDAIPAKRLTALRPLLADLAEPDFIIETDLTDKERALIAEGMIEYEKNPASFITLAEYKKSRGIKTKRVSGRVK